MIRQMINGKMVDIGSGEPGSVETRSRRVAACALRSGPVEDSMYRYRREYVSGVTDRIRALRGDSNTHCDLRYGVWGLERAATIAYWESRIA